MLKHLKPISNQHSISKIAATIFIPQIFLKPEDVFEKMKNMDGFNGYQKKNLIKARTININQNNFGISNDKVNGFLFESFDKLGSINNILIAENIKDNQSKVSIENRHYSGWKSFKEKIDEDLQTFCSGYDFYIEAIGLNYRDEFNWEDKNQKIPINEIFNIDSELLNNKFLDSKNGTLILISQGDLDNDSFEEKTEISFNNDLNRIIIDHHYAIRFRDIKLFSKLNKNSKFSTLYETAHDENKKIMKDILSVETQTLINLS